MVETRPTSPTMSHPWTQQVNEKEKRHFYSYIPCYQQSIFSQARITISDPLKESPYQIHLDKHVESTSEKKKKHSSSLQKEEPLNEEHIPATDKLGIPK